MKGDIEYYLFYTDFGKLIWVSLLIGSFFLIWQYVLPNINWAQIEKDNQVRKENSMPIVFKKWSCVQLRDYIVNHEGEWSFDLYLSDAKEIFKYKFGGVCQ